MPDTGEFTPPDVQVRRTTEERIMPVVQLAFSPLHKAAFGIATGTAGAILVMTLTIAWLVFPRVSTFPLHLLGQYFTGYDTTWPGTAVGGLWAFATGFVAGWFVAFCRNLALAVSAFTLRTRAELGETREFLDHI
ncbi:MAG: hypothetical protein ACT4OZ_02530 [Gemmatimonadota bacterium]